MPESFQIEAAGPAPRRGPRKHLLGLLVVCALLLAAVLPHQSLTGAAMAVHTTALLPFLGATDAAAFQVTPGMHTKRPAAATSPAVPAAGDRCAGRAGGPKMFVF